jgi:pimeloyl-ACP methyl ester carboxylesterase
LPRADEAAPTTIPARLTRSHFGDAVVNLLYDTESARRIPELIDAAARGDWSPLLAEISPEGRSIVRGGPEALYLSVSCPEETSTFALEERDPLDAERVLGEERLLRQKAACAAWPQRAVRDGFLQPLRSAIPTLVFSGELDPVTPPPWGELLISTLERARLVVIPGMGHSVAGMSDPTCPDRIAVAFAAEPDPSLVDRSCIRSMRSPPFVPEAEPRAGS